jgi:AP2-associated kinase
MLQEHGISRPSVFELLTHVHTLRGTKSRFHYTIPVPQPLSPRQQTQFKPSSNPSYADNTVSSSARPVISNARPSAAIASSPSPSKNQGIQAREKVLEAIAPMRRGRPTVSKEPISSSKPESPHKHAGLLAGNSEKGKHWMNGDFIADDDNAWKAVASNTLAPRKDEAEDVWKIDGKEPTRSGKRKDKPQGFGDDFAEKLWDTFNPNDIPSTQPKASIEATTISRIPNTNTTRTPTLNGPDARPSSSKDKDAFAGLGLGPSSDRRAPTLGEARKLRTGLAVMNTNTHGFRYDRDTTGTGFSRLTPSPRLPYNHPNPQPQPQTLSSPPPPNSTKAGSSWRTSPPPSTKQATSQFDGLPAENRFPSLEELDATFSPDSGDVTSSNAKTVSKQIDSGPLHRRNSNFGRGMGTNNLLKPGQQPRGSYGQDGIRSEQVTGIAMRESRGGSSGYTVGRDDGIEGVKPADVKRTNELPSSNTSVASRPTLTRKHRSSVTMKHASRSSAGEDSSNMTSHSPPVAEHLAPPSSRFPISSTKDWLTGDDNSDNPSTSIISLPRVETPVLRDSPSKRASFIQRSNVPISDAVTAQQGHTPLPRRTPSPPGPTPVAVSPTLSRFTRNFPPIETTDDSKDTMGALTENWSPVTTRIPGRPRDVESSSSADEGPEDAGGNVRPIAKSKENPKRMRRKGRQSSVHDLVDLWGGGVGPKDKERDPYSVRSDGNKSELSFQREKSRPMVSPLISAKANPNPRSTSPHQLLSPPSASSGQQMTSSDQNHNKSPSGGPMTSHSPTRSRPQSMFMFPSKSTDGVSTGASLLPPEEPVQRSSIRRTSISDMVQRYEGIGAKPKSAGLGGPPSAVDTSRPTSKLTPVLTENGRFSRGQVNSEGEKTSLLSLPNNRSSSSRGPTDTHRASPVPLRTSPIGAPTPLQHDAIRKESENPVPRPRRASLKPDISRPTFPSRKSTEDSLLRSGDGRSPSPERPYQGVGKLIDQWQRKTAEAEPPRTGAGRGAFPAKRVGAVHGAPGRGR